MFRFFFSASLLIYCVLSSFGQSYPVSVISDSLLKNANAVVREEVYTYRFDTPSRNSVQHRTVISVLNKNGDNHADLTVFYDRYSTVKYIHCAVYDASGNPVRKIKSSEISDNSVYAFNAQFDDIRYRYFNPRMSVYPYTVEYEYELEYSGSNDFPEWFFNKGDNISIEHSTFRVVVPENYKLNWKSFNDCTNPVITPSDKMVTYEWKHEGIGATKEEPYEDDIIKHVKAVYTAPSDFSLAGYDGNLNTWNDYAKWIGTLNKGRDELPEERVTEIRQMLIGINNDYEKTRFLYRYMQSRTRYFNIAFGIGGLQPEYAETVDKVGFGDCKGLSNYMKALLKAVGINSYYAVVEAGEHFPELIADFPKHQFNHAMLCVPLEEDTVWLECTNQLSPFGFLGDFTSDRTVLLIKENGGELVQTPAYSLEKNMQNTFCKVILTQDGKSEAEIRRTFCGIQFTDYLSMLYKNTEDQQEWLYEYWDIPDFKINSFNFKCPDINQPSSVLKASLSISAYGSASGKRIFLPLNLLNKYTYVPEKIHERRTNIKLTYPYFDSDTIVYIIPDGMETEFLPEPCHMASSFGAYDSHCEKKDNQIVYYRQLKVFKGVFPKNLYNDLVKFFYDISVADKCQAILIKKQA